VLSARLHRLAESIPGFHKRLQIRALCSEGKSDGLPVCSTTATQLLHLSSDPYLLLQAEPIFYILYSKREAHVFLKEKCREGCYYVKYVTIENVHLA
jgi:hypothetical protein